MPIDNSLSRLQTDYLDLYQLWPEKTNTRVSVKPLQDDDINIHEVLTTLDGFIKEGKIKHIGLSNENPWGIMRF
jgi:aryl-alcohol dehydrogenase-like predicted oxidoreductase